MEDFYFQTKQLCVGYDGEALIRDISIGIRRGEIVTLIGPNGSGKSTILKSITRQLKAIAGTVLIGERELRGLSHRELATRMAVVLTERMKPELMTCWDVVSSGRYPYTGRLGILTPKDEAQVRSAMEAVHALDLSDREFNAISDGQRQRVLLARAICQEPEAIVLDEPTSFLDIRHKLELLTILKDLVREKQVAVLMSLHELDLAQKLSDYIICVNGDTIERLGTPEEIFTSSYITQLYGISKGSYHAELGCLEMEPVKGKPEVFVIGGNGSGIPVYRKLQRRGIPFAAGILHENDIDYPVARALAAEVVSEAPFELIKDRTYERAAALLASCERVICCIEDFGPVNEKNRRLAELGKHKEKYI